MTPGDFRLLLAPLVGLHEKTIAIFDRILRAEGLRSKSGRGTSAAQITPRDAANMLIAVMASDNISKSATMVRLFADTRAAPAAPAKKIYGATGVHALMQLSPAHSFVDVVEALIASAADEVGAECAPARSKTKPPVRLPPLIDVVTLTPSIIGDIRLAGLENKRSVIARYTLPSPFDRPRSRAPSNTELLAWEADVRQRRGDVDMEQSRRISAKTIRRIAEAIATT